MERKTTFHVVIITVQTHTTLRYRAKNGYFLKMMKFNKIFLRIHKNFGKVNFDLLYIPKYVSLHYK